MSASINAARRSGDPRRRNRPEPQDRAHSRRRAVGTVLAVGMLGLGIVVLALLAPRPGDASSVDAQARVHAAAACDLTAKAGEAAKAVEIESRARYAAAALLLDRAIIESARAVGADTALADLDVALQAVHSAGHAGDPNGWDVALEMAMIECGSPLP